MYLKNKSNFEPLNMIGNNHNGINHSNSNPNLNQINMP